MDNSGLSDTHQRFWWRIRKLVRKQEDNLETIIEPGSDYPTETAPVITEPVIEAIVMDIDVNICECVRDFLT